LILLFRSHAQLARYGKIQMKADGDGRWELVPCLPTIKKKHPKKKCVDCDGECDARGERCKQAFWLNNKY
jgi:hypothetical protein